MKVKSQRGASITFALLLFLVCAVVSSVVIAASTTAAGRMSNQADMDQRYYAVTSASGLLRGHFDQRRVTVTHRKNPAGSLAAYEATKVEDVSDPASPSVLPDPSPILTDASVALVEALDAPTATWPIQTSLTLQSSGKPALDCTIQAQLESSGLLVFDVSNTLPAAARKKTVYTLRIVFASNVRRIASDALSDTEDTVVTWTFHSLKKIRAYEETTP